MKIFKFPLIYGCLMTSLGGNFCLSQSADFVNFSFKNLGIFYNRLLVIPKDDEIFFGRFYNFPAKSEAGYHDALQIIAPDLLDKPQE